jgi:hypothetical protein
MKIYHGDTEFTENKIIHLKDTKNAKEEKLSFFFVTFVPLW